MTYVKQELQAPYVEQKLDWVSSWPSPEQICRKMANMKGASNIDEECWKSVKIGSCLSAK
jgi:hypothetical protein